MGAKVTEAVNFLEKKVKAMSALEGLSYEETCQTAIAALQVRQEMGAWPGQGFRVKAWTHARLR